MDTGLRRYDCGEVGAPQVKGGVVSTLPRLSVGRQCFASPLPRPNLPEQPIKIPADYLFNDARRVLRAVHFGGVCIKIVTPAQAGVHATYPVIETDKDHSIPGSLH
jgi:hypothetical protein